MKPELLAPANLRTLTAAVQAGADAIYLAGSEFGARKFADNFGLFEMEKAVDYCHLRGVKVYLAANILIDNSEKNRFLNFIKDAYNIGVDAFIMQDIGMATLVKNCLPNARLHASTQLTVHNTEGASFMKEIGFDRVVLSRELSKEEIFDIAEKSGIETEVFVHGALCMCYSGQCLMSSMIGGRSGNRGSCAQPCRLPYDIHAGEKSIGRGYFLSPRDLCLAGKMTSVIKTGVSSLKIEGRMKGEEYVAAAVSVFRKLIDENRNATENEKFMLENAFSRDGFTTGAFEGGEKRYINARKGNDDIYKDRDLSVLKPLKKYLEQGANIKKTPAHFNVKVIQGEKITLTACAMGFESKVFGDVPQFAQNKIADKETIEKQIAKTGDYPFFAEKINVETDNKSFLKLSEINGLRRDCLNILEEKIIGSFKKNQPEIKCVSHKTKRERAQHCLAVMVSTKEQLTAVRELNIGRIFAPCNLANGSEIAVFPDIIHNDNLPKYLRLVENTQSVYTSNPAILKRAKELGKGIVLSPSANVFNSESISFWEKFGVDEIILSQELNLGQISALDSKTLLGVIGYGRAVMMKTFICPIKSAMGKCRGQSPCAYLKDRKNEKFPVVCDGMTSFILNSKPTYMADKLRDISLAGINTVLIQFTDENPEKCREIINKFLNEDESEVPFTRGHFYRGVT